MYNAGGNPPFSAAVTNSKVSMEAPGTDLATGATIVNPIPIAGITSHLANRLQAAGNVFVQRRSPAPARTGDGSDGQLRGQPEQAPVRLPEHQPAGSIAASEPHRRDAKYTQVVPYKGYSNINMAETAQNAHYNSLQVTARSQMQDLTLQGSYTLSRSIDPVINFGSDNGNTLYNPYNGNQTYGVSLVDATHIAVLSFVYDVPLLRHSSSRLAKSVVGGWQLSGVWSMQSGFPLNITLGNPSGFAGYGNNGIPTGSTNMPNLTGSVSYNKTQQSWFTTTGFGVPLAGTWGNYGRQVRGPGRNNWNIAMFKDFAIREAMKFELRFESFNTFNHTQFNGTQNSYANGQFGQVTSAWDPRMLQLAAKFLF